MNKKIKIVVSSTATIFLLLLYCLIFSFSEQDGETSGSFSRMISEKCVVLWNAIAGKNWSEMVIQSWAEYFENPIRKVAHFCEYAVMGALLFGIWYPWLGLTCKKYTTKAGKVRESCPLLLKISIPWIFISAAFDEIHQLFVPDRYGSFADVLLDTAGGCFGLFCCVYSVKIGKQLKKKKLKKKL